MSFEVTNSTYSYLAMTLGDGFASAFTTGSYFELKIFGYTGLNGTGTEVGEVDFYLANYTSASSLPVDVWTLVNLSSLAGRQSLTFDYASSDVGEFGINTPEYFAMDNLILSTSVPEPSSVILAMTGLGIVGLAAAHRHRRRLAAPPRCKSSHSQRIREQPGLAPDFAKPSDLSIESTLWFRASTGPPLHGGRSPSAPLWVARLNPGGDTQAVLARRPGIGHRCTLCSRSRIPSVFWSGPGYDRGMRHCRSTHGAHS